MIMKKILYVMLVGLLAALSPKAHAFEVDGIYYGINSDNTTVFVTYGPNKYRGDITIPNTIVYEGKTYTVSAIGHSAFNGCNDLTRVVMGNTINLIGSDAFSGCRSLIAVTISQSVRTIANFAFYGCSALTEIIIPDNVTSIGQSICSYCTSLKSATIGDGATGIGYQAFINCRQLKEITIGKNVAYIGDEAFLNCTGLTKVNIKDLAAWCLIDFEGSAVANPLCYAHHLFLDGQEIKDLIIPETITQIRNFTFNGGSGFTSVDLGNVTSIGWASFSLCTGLETINFGRSLTTIGNSAFSSCTGLKSLKFPRSLTSIGSYAFEDCDSLTSVRCLSITPPEMQDGNTFSYTCLLKATLTVPKNSISNYTAKWCEWRAFRHIVESEFYECDVNCDGGVNIADINMIVDAIISGQTDDIYDVNYDGEINIADINEIVNMILAI